MSEELIDKLLSEQGAQPQEPAPSDEIALYEEMLGITLPAAFKLLLAKSNGGEFAICRLDTPFIPPDLAARSAESLWQNHDEVLEARQLPAAGPATFLPLGDDYSGEVVALDLRPGSTGQIICSSDSSRSLDEFIVEGKDFTDWVEQSLSAAEHYEAHEERREKPRLEARPIPDSLKPLDTHARQVLATDFDVHQSFFLESAIHPAGVWLEVTHKKLGGLWLRFDHVSTPMENFGGISISTGQENIVFTIAGEQFCKETFKNVTLAGERCNEMRPLYCDDPFPMGRAKISKESESLIIAESNTREYLEPLQTKAKTVVVCTLRDGAYHRMTFDLTNFESIGQVDQVINTLLSYGFDWIP